MFNKWIKSDKDIFGECVSGNVTFTAENFNGISERKMIVSFKQCSEYNEKATCGTDLIITQNPSSKRYVYKFEVEGTEGNLDSNIAYTPVFSYSGGTHKTKIKSYVEVWNGIEYVEYYKPVSWTCLNDSCDWIIINPKSNTGTTSVDSFNDVDVIVSERDTSSSSEYRECRNIKFIQDQSNLSVLLTVGQDGASAGTKYTFNVEYDSNNINVCELTEKEVTITSLKYEYLNGVEIEGSRKSVGYSAYTDNENANATYDNNPTEEVTKSVITIQPNNTDKSNNIIVKYKQNESNEELTVSLHQDAATCATYAIGQLKLDVGDGMTTSATKNAPMSASTFEVSFESPQYRSLCGVSSNTKCDTLVEPYKIKSIPDWLTSKIGTVESTSTDTISVSQNSSTEGRTGSIVYTNGTYDASINVIQEQGISRIYKFIVNGVTGTTSSPQSNLEEFKYTGGSQTIQIKSYVEIQNGGVFDHYEAVPWSCTTCNWITPSMSSGSGVSSTASTESNTLTASAQAESSTDNTRCCDMIFTQGSSGYKVKVHVCQEECISGYSRQVAWNPEVLEFDPCSESSIEIELTSSKQKWINSVNVGEPIPVELTCTNLSWASGSTVPSPTSITNTYTITASSNVNGSTREGEIEYRQIDMPTTVITLDLHQDAGTGCVHSIMWSEPKEGSVYDATNNSSISASSITFTAYADTTGATYSDCSLVIPSGQVTHGEIQGTGSDGKRSVWVDLTIKPYFGDTDYTCDVTINI